MAALGSSGEARGLTLDLRVLGWDVKNLAILGVRLFISSCSLEGVEGRIVGDSMPSASRRAPRAGARPDPLNDQLVGSLSERRFAAGGLLARTPKRHSIRVCPERFAWWAIGKRWTKGGFSRRAASARECMLLLSDGLGATGRGIAGMCLRCGSHAR